jgi:hypothetical protein
MSQLEVGAARAPVTARARVIRRKVDIEPETSQKSLKKN